MWVLVEDGDKARKDGANGGVLESGQYSPAAGRRPPGRAHSDTPAFSPVINDRAARISS